MTAGNSLTQVSSTHTNVEDSSKYIRQIFVHHTTRVHLQLQTFLSDIIWIMSTEIILLLFIFNLILTSLRYCIN
jgi:hypothetical protein